MVSNRETTIAVDALREQQLEELFAYYVDRLNEGDELNPQEILAKHPGLGADLLEYLEGYIDPDAAPSMPSDRTLGDYTIRREIGRGGMGVVYDAWQNSLDRRVALKVLPLGIAASDRAFERFMREARTAAKLDHQNIVRVHGMGVEANTPYYSMEYVEGRTLAQILAAMESDSDAAVDAPFAPASDGSANYVGMARAFAEVADGLQHAHEKGVIHRDIKPSNLILDHAGHLRILDFGLARFEGEESLTLTGDLLGTPMYMSPEQARRRQIPIDHRTDIYSLGATLYEVLTHRPPFQGEDHRDTLSRIIEQDPQPLRRVDPAIPRDLGTIVLKCLRKNARDRYDTAQALAEDLRRFARGEPVEAQPLPPWAGVTRRAWKYGPRTGVIAMAATLVFLLASLLLPTEGMVTRQVWAPAENMTGTPSPDGRYITYIHWNTGNLAIHDLKTGENRDITVEGTWTWKGQSQWPNVSIWSPDSRQVAYSWHKGDDLELRIVGLDGSKSRVLAGIEPEGGQAPWPRAWSQDGKYILAIVEKKDESPDGHEDHIVLVSVADGSSRVLKSLGEQPTRNMSLSPDGRYVVFELQEKKGSEKRDIYLLATDGSSEMPLVEHPADDWAPFWTPDGQRIVFASDRSGSNGLWMLDVNDGRPNGTPTQIKEMGSRFVPMGFTGDGSFYYGDATMANDVYVATLDFEAGKVVAPPIKVSLRYERSNFAPFWSPDGKRLAYVSQRSSEHVLVIRSVESGQERDLSPKTTVGVAQEYWKLAPQWSPDGGSILVTGKDSKDSEGLYLVDAETGNVTPIVQDESKKAGGDHTHRSWPVFSNDGKQIYFIDGPSLMVHNLETHEERELYRANTGFHRLALSPDGRRLAFLDCPLELRTTTVKIISTSGGEPSELSTLKKGERRFGCVALSWTHDGAHVVVGRTDDTPDSESELWRIPVTGGEPHKLNLGVKVRHLSLHPDGRRIAFTRPEREGWGDIWVMENFLP
ncbi:MAG: protein kinase [Phycisphaerales bacterium]